MSGRLHVLALIIVMLVPAIPNGAETIAPQRLVSFNLCADQLALALADPGQIAGLSPFAADRELSVMAERARGFPQLDQRSEVTVALQPDLVLVGPNDRSTIRRALTALGLHVHEVGVVRDVGEAKAQVRELARLLGHPQRGETLIAALERAQARLAAAVRVQGATALVIERRGYVAGPHSLAAALLRESGYAAPPGAPGGLGGFVSLERLLMLRPDLLVLHDPVTQAEDQGTLFLAHPALAALYPPARRFVLPRRYALCGGPALVEALDFLTATLAQRPSP